MLSVNSSSCAPRPSAPSSPSARARGRGRSAGRQSYQRGYLCSLKVNRTGSPPSGSRGAAGSRCSPPASGSGACPGGRRRRRRTCRRPRAPGSRPSGRGRPPWARAGRRRPGASDVEAVAALHGEQLVVHAEARLGGQVVDSRARSSAGARARRPPSSGRTARRARPPGRLERRLLAVVYEVPATASSPTELRMRWAIRLEPGGVRQPGLFFRAVPGSARASPCGVAHDLVLQLHDPVDQRLGRGGQPGHVDVDGQELVGARTTA